MSDWQWPPVPPADSYRYRRGELNRPQHECLHGTSTPAEASAPEAGAGRCCALLLRPPTPLLADGATAAGDGPLLATGAEVALSGGTISLQAESHSLDFRKVEYLDLKEK